MELGAHCLLAQAKLVLSAKDTLLDHMGKSHAYTNSVSKALVAPQMLGNDASLPSGLWDPPNPFLYR